MWLGRCDLRDPVLRRRLVVSAASIVALTESAAWFLVGPKGAPVHSLAPTSWRWLFWVEPIPPMPAYLAAGGGTAVLVIVGSLWLGEHLPLRVSEPLVSTGQLALTLYLAHVLVGLGILSGLGRLKDQTLGYAVAAALLFDAAAVAFCFAWRRRFARGPLEWVMRRVAG